MAIEAGCLWFWRPKRNQAVKPEELCGLLSDHQRPTELHDLPVDDILSALKRQYPALEWNMEARAGEVDIPEEQTAIEPRWSAKHFFFTFYGDARKQMHRVVQLMTKFGLACYDAGERKMHTVRKPPRFVGTVRQEALTAMWDKVMMEEFKKIEDSTPDRREQVKLKKAFVDSGGLKRTREEAARRLNER